VLLVSHTDLRLIRTAVTMTASANPRR